MLTLQLKIFSLSGDHNIFLIDHWGGNFQYEQMDGHEQSILIS